MIIDAQLDAWVANGLAWIRENGEKYYIDLSRFDPLTLDMGYPKRCLLGQCCTKSYNSLGYSSSGYGTVRSLLINDGVISPWGDARADWFMVSHGFTLINDIISDPSDWRRLGDAWIRALAP